MEIKTKKTYFCIGKKWWDKINGNTYCNAKVIDGNGKTLFYIGFQYGYGSYYYSESKKQLQNTLGNDNFNLVDLGAEYTLKKTTKSDF